MSIIYAKSFAACCTARASRRGRRAGRAGEEGRGSGEPRKSDWGGEPGGSDSCHPGGLPGSLPGQEWKAGGAGHAAPSEVPVEVVPFWKVREWEREHGSPDWGPYATFPSAQDWDRDSQRPPFLSGLSQLPSSTLKVKSMSIPKPQAGTPLREKGGNADIAQPGPNQPSEQLCPSSISRRGPWA